MSDQPDVATVLAQLERERAELDITIAHLKRRLGLATDTDAASPVALGGVSNGGGRDVQITGRVRADEFFRLSIADAIAKYLGIMKRPEMPATIVAGLRNGGVLTNAKNFPANVNTELKRMRERGLVVNTTAGWGLSEWYPQKPKQPEAPRKKSAKKRWKRHATAEAAAERDSASARGSSPWHAFLAKAQKAGKTMKEAAEEWRAQKKAAGLE
jgi:hypothetical protein